MTGLRRSLVQFTPSEEVAYPIPHTIPVHPAYHILNRPASNNTAIEFVADSSQAPEGPGERTGLSGLLRNSSKLELRRRLPGAEVESRLVSTPAVKSNCEVQVHMSPLAVVEATTDMARIIGNTILAELVLILRTRKANRTSLGPSDDHNDERDDKLSAQPRKWSQVLSQLARVLRPRGRRGRRPDIAWTA